jgi:hypothetical protein
LEVYFGRSPTGRAIRCNGLFVTSQTISTAIPNAGNLKAVFQISLKNGFCIEALKNGLILHPLRNTEQLPFLPNLQNVISRRQLLNI